MTIPSSVVAPHEVRDRLHRLGLVEAIIHEAVSVGYEHASTCTHHDPLILPGTLAWAKCIAQLRDALVTEGWTANRDLGFETVVHPSNTHAIAVAAGTADTGRHDGTPRTRTPKGRVTQDMVFRNAQLTLAGVDPAFGPYTVPDSERETWFLLHHLDDDAGEIRAELALPSEMKGAMITHWRERLIVAPIPVDLQLDIHDDEPIDVDVRRRPT